jgi:hypothetical protein
MGNEHPLPNSEIINFETIHKYVGITDPELFDIYLNEVANDFSNRNKIDKTINKIDFVNYLKFPYFISDKLFNSFDSDNDGKLSKDEFINGLKKLYFGTFEEIAQIIFNLLDYDKDKKIRKEDVKLMLLYLPSINDQSNEQIQDNCKEIDSILNQTFIKFSKGLKFKQFLKIILKKCSDVFIQLICYFYLNKPFNSENINKIQKKNFQHLFTKNINCINSYRDNKKSINILKNCSSSLSINNNSKNRNLLTSRINNINIEKNFSYKDIFSPRKKTIKKSYDSNNQQTNINHLIKSPKTHINNFYVNNLIENFSSDINTTDSSDEVINEKYENYVFKLINNDKMEKIFLSLMNSDLYIYSDETKVKFIQMHNLKGSIIKNYLLEDEVVIFDKEKYYYFEIIYCSNEKIYFYSKDKNIIQNFTERIKKAINFHSISDYYIIKELIGKGKFGQVNLGINKKTNEKVAIKIIKKSTLTTIQDLELVKTEIDIMRISHHKNIVKLYDKFENEKYIFIIMEYINGETLSSYLKKKHFCISEKKICEIMKQIGEGIYYLHSFGIVHRDIKPDNILINDKNEIKIIDFGFSKIMGNNEKTNEGFGTLDYAAPEILLRIPYGKEIDIWAMGILLFYILTGRSPFIGINEDDLAQQIILESVTFNDNEWGIRSNLVINLIENCLVKQPSLRIDIKGFLKHSWFKSML